MGKIVVFSAAARAMRAAHKRALSAPMTRTPMIEDPHMGKVTMLDSAFEFALEPGRANLERRACQYAGWIAERDRMLRRPLRDYDATYAGGGIVYLTIYHGLDPHEVKVTIPRHVMEFDANAAPIALEAPEEPIAAPPERCEHTASLALAAPGKSASASVRARGPATRPKPRKAATRHASEPERRFKIIYIHGARVEMPVFA